MLEKFFGLRHHGTTPQTEILAGLTIFLTMSYILAVNPYILSVTGMEKQSVFVATCLTAAFGSLMMAFFANWPVGTAPSMGLNAFFSYTVVVETGYTWQEALGAVFISGLIFLLLTATGVRKWLIAGIPQSLRSAIAAGIGMFLAMIAFKESGIIIASEKTLVSLGRLVSIGPILTVLGFFLIILLDSLKIRGAILISILTVTAISFFIGANNFQGLPIPISVPVASNISTSTKTRRT